ncbi:glycerophosphodiester phosphodiesterase [Shewanella cyperi]|uniref:Glycerophosphodiester phosphodiesterase n=1 Tax=Shewanella cyperi TaxID=2814292 RepID=A0A974XLZ5_9GAMM|nr:glycerophosphodiester phosphodiesterase family protein [Shewanella cyperi]QSX29486.1 glycerophosphodiester phosphodiesterase [Shewanella cyperi]
MLIFAHRGASGYAPENTLAAMEKALELGVEAIELDIHAVEGELMVFHDRRLEGKSDGKGFIRHKTLAELSKVRVRGEAVPSLWQVLELIRGRCLVNIELKGQGTVAPLVPLYHRAIAELGFTPEQLLLSSFNHPYLAQLRQQLPKARLAPLLGSLPLDLAAVAGSLGAYSIHLDVDFISRAMVDDAHRRGVKVYVYTVDDAEEIQALRQLGVDGIFANYPDRAQAALAVASVRDYSHWFD